MNDDLDDCLHLPDGDISDDDPEVVAGMKRLSDLRALEAEIAEIHIE